MAVQQFQNTRYKRVRLSPQQGTSGGIMRWTLDAAGILGGIYIGIRGTLTGTLSALNGLGFCSLIRQVTVKLSTGQILYLGSGAGYTYVVRDHINDYRDPTPQNNGRSAVAASAYNLDMFIPIAINDRDMPGLILLQNKEVTVLLTVEEEVSANVATGITGGLPLVSPAMDFFTVPVAKEDRPPLNLVHSWVEEGPIAVSGAGNLEYQWPRGNSILSMHHMLGVNTTPADHADSFAVVAQQNDYIFNDSVIEQDEVFNKFHGRARILGTYHDDMIGSSGLGSYGSARDIMVTPNLTSIKSVLHATAADNIYHIRRELIAVKEPDAIAG